MGQFPVSWQGRQTVWGLWFPPQWQESERLLCAWQPGCRLLQAWRGWLLIYARPQVLQAQQAPAQAVVAVAQGWSSFRKGRPGPNQLALRWHGQNWLGNLAELVPVELADLWDWKELSYELARVAPPALIKPFVVRTAPEPVRQILQAIPPPAPEQEQLLQRLRQPTPPTSAKNPLLGFFDLLKSVFGSPENQRYMNKMLQLFEQKNWQEALRHAIPLNDSATSSQLGAFLGELKPRSRLEFTSPSQFGASLDTSLHGMDLLKDIYRRALSQLIAAGRIEEAAYVQGELLGDAAGAAELLEQHQRFEAAARLATLKGLPAALQVRLWFQAGRAETAMLLARRYGVQAEALQMLQRKDRQLANQFRAAWATDLADAGRQTEAITVGWSVREQLEDYELWLRSALAAGGPAAVEVLVLGLRDAELTERLGLMEVLQEWFRDFDLLTQPRRRLLLERLAASWLETSHAGLRDWAGQTARRVMRQANSPLPLGNQRTLEFLVNLSGDAWLRADRVPSMGENAPRLGLWSETIEACGHTPLYDALSLGDGRMLVAMGQAGLTVLARGGAVSQRFAQPVYDLIQGERQLLRSGHNLSWFEGNQVRFWCQAALDGWADEHDGYHWLVWLDRQLFQIDLLSPEWRALQSLELAARPLDASLGVDTVGLDLGFELHILRLPQLDSRGRFPIPSGPQLCTSRLVEPFQIHGERLHFRGLQLHLEGKDPQIRERGGFCLIQSAYAQGQELLVFPLDNPSLQFSLKLPGADRLKVRVQGWMLILCDNRGRLLVADLKARTWMGQFFL